MLDEESSMAHALETRAIFMSVIGSNAIEGIVTSEDRAVKLMAGDTGPRGHDELEIVGYRDALRYIHENHGTMNVDVRTILDLYRTMMQYSEPECDTYELNRPCVR